MGCLGKLHALLRPHLGVQNSLVFPFVLIRRGHMVAFGYGALLIFMTAWGFRELLLFFLHYLDNLILEFDLSKSFQQRAEIFALIAAWVLAIPVVLTGIILPCRLVWIFNRIPISALFRETFSSLKLCLRTIIALPMVLFYDILPALALLACYLITKSKFSQESLHQVIFMGLIFGMVAVIIRAIPRILAPIVAILGQYHPRHALAVSLDALQNWRLALSAITFSGILLLYGAHSWISSTTLSTNTKRILLVAADSAIVWYVLIALTGMALKALTAFEMAQRPHVPPAAPEPPVYFTTVDPRIEVIAAPSADGSGKQLIIQLKEPRL